MDLTVPVQVMDEDPLTMPPTPDYIRILSEARERTADDPDARHARARRAQRGGLRAFLRRWSGGRPRSAEEPVIPRLRDYPWGSPDRA